MRHLLSLLLLALLATATTHAQRRIDLRHAGGSTIFSELPAALAAAADGDTLYLPGGGFPGFTLSKKLAVIGVGHHPDSTAATVMSYISGSINLNPGSSGSLFTGLRVNGTIQVPSSYDIDNIKISRCFVYPGIYGNSSIFNLESWVITECMVGQIYYLKNAMISNSLVSIDFGVLRECQVEHNIILSGNISDVDNSTVSNNIIRYSNGGNGCDNSLFYNNIYSSGSLPNAPFGSNIGIGNISDTDFDGLFEDFSYTTYNQNMTNLYQFDFHLTNAAYNTGGTNGTPIGIYGGVFPWKAGAVPFTPHINLKSIAPTTNSAGQLPVVIRAKAQGN